MLPSKRLESMVKAYTYSMQAAECDEGFIMRQRVREAAIRKLEDEAAEDLFATGMRIYEEELKKEEA